MADSDRERALESALANIEKQFGKGAVMRLGDDTAQQVPAIPTGALTLDVALGVGGLPRGRVVELYGPESSGKTTLALHVLAEAQKQGGIAAFIDAEHALDPTYAGAIGLDIDELLVAQPDTGEQALEIMDMLIRSGAVDVIAVDSVAALTPRAEIEGEMGDSHVGLQARLMSQAMRKLAGSLKKSSTCAIFINQIREKIGVMFGSPETTPGGRALKFYSSVRLDIRRIETLKDGKDAVGNRCRVKVVKNKCLAAGTRVFDPTTGLTHAIEDIVEEGAGTSVWATDKRGRLEARPIGARLDQGEQEVIGLRLPDGTELTVTPDHRILTEEGWREAGELGVGDRVARPRRAGSFGDEEPVPPARARMLGCLLGDGPLAPERRIPAGLFAPEVSREVLGNLLVGLWETAGWISREQAGGLRLGFDTTSEQLAWQLHWLLLRFGIVSTAGVHEPGSCRSLVEGRRIRGSRPCWQVRVSGIDDVRRFAAEVPTWGPRSRTLVEALDDPASAGQQESRAVYLPASVTEPVRSYLADRGVSARDAAGMIGAPAGDPRGGMAQVLGATRIRRDRLAALADALESRFLRDLLAEEVYYERIQEVTAPRTERTYDLEVPELHNLVADGVVVHNCAPPFRQAEFDIVYGEGISKEGSLLDLGVEEGLIRKAGAWYSYDDEQLGQGRENARQFLREHDDIAREIEKRIKEELGIAPLAGDADETDEDEGEE